MELKITIDETMFKEVVESELNSLPKEVIQEVIIEAIKEYIKESDNVKKLLFKEQHSWGSGSAYYTEPSSAFIELISKVDISDEISEVKDEVSRIIKSDSRKIVENMFIKSFSRALASTLQEDNYMSEMIEAFVTEATARNRCNG